MMGCNLALEHCARSSKNDETCCCNDAQSTRKFFSIIRQPPYKSKNRAILNFDDNFLSSAAVPDNSHKSSTGVSVQLDFYEQFSLQQNSVPHS